MDGEILVDDHARVVIADGGDPHEALVLDVLDDEPELVHVRAEHHGGRTVAAAPREVVVPEGVGVVVVVVAAKLVGDDVGNQALVPGDADGGIEGGEQVEHPVWH